MTKGKALIVTAHPDDEAMFFGPTIQRLVQDGTSVNVLCLSTGNAEGVGRVRRDELLYACEELGVPKAQVDVRDIKELQDGMATHWDETLVAELVNGAARAMSARVIISFDSHGVSGHVNHRAVHRGLLHAMRGMHNLDARDTASVEAWQLVSTGMLRKFMGPLDVAMSLFEAATNPGQLVCNVAPSPWRIVRAMARHRSQWVWFRKLFIAFSRYTYVNTLQRINI